MTPYLCPPKLDGPGDPGIVSSRRPRILVRGPERLGYGAGMRTQRWRPRWMVGALAVAAAVVFWCLAARGGGCSDASFDSTCTTSTMGGLPGLVGVLIVGTSAVACCVVRAFRR